VEESLGRGDNIEEGHFMEVRREVWKHAGGNVVSLPEMGFVGTLGLRRNSPASR